MPSALRLTGLHKTFGEKIAVDHIDLSVPHGSFFGLVGPNGAGKTTALSMAVGLLRPMPQEVSVDVWPSVAPGSFGSCSTGWPCRAAHRAGNADLRRPAARA